MTLDQQKQYLKEEVKNTISLLHRFDPCSAKECTDSVQLVLRFTDLLKEGEDVKPVPYQKTIEALVVNAERRFFQAHQDHRVVFDSTKAREAWFKAESEAHPGATAIIPYRHCQFGFSKEVQNVQVPQTGKTSLVGRGYYGNLQLYWPEHRIPDWMPIAVSDVYYFPTMPKVWISEVELQDNVLYLCVGWKN